MLTTDVAVAADPSCHVYVKEFARGVQAFADAFADAFATLVQTSAM